MDLTTINTSALDNLESRFLLRQHLDAMLAQIVEHDTDYEVRNPLVFIALAAALSLGYAVGFRTDPKEPNWFVAYIELPLGALEHHSGQVSWHVPQHTREWDGHTTQEKFERIQAFVSPLLSMR